jgi:2',3'-cyclic-nucleotide 2'-phosphodiesterase (5'-nucleotidase family)
MKRIGLLLFAVLLSFSCRSAPREIVIFHTNDIHGHFTAESADWRDDHALVGGVSALSFYLDSLRREYPQSFYTDAGDLMTGNPICNMKYDGVEGGALLTMLQRCGVAAMSLGNHEFDLGADHLRNYIAAAPYVVCSNLRDKRSGQLVAAAARTIEVGGVRIGIIGVLLDELNGVVGRKALEPFVVDNAVVSVQREIDKLDPSTDLIVVLSHVGVENDSLMALKLRGADVIVGGHSHTRLNKPLHVNGVTIVQTGSYLKNLGVLRLQVAGDSVVSDSGWLVELRVPKTMPRTDAASFADSLEIVIQSQFGQVIGDLEITWQGSYYSGSNAGNWICDRLRERYKADIALVNAGGIRGGINAGPVTKLDVVQLLPFSNSIVLFNVAGSDLRKFAMEQARAQGLHQHGAVEMSGMSVKYGARDGNVQVKSITVGGKALDDAKTYRVASIDYVALSQWNRYLGFEPSNVDVTGELISDVIIDEIAQTRTTIRTDSAPRLMEVP